MNRDRIFVGRVLMSMDRDNELATDLYDCLVVKKRAILLKIGESAYVDLKDIYGRKDILKLYIQGAIKSLRQQGFVLPAKSTKPYELYVDEGSLVQYKGGPIDKQNIPIMTLKRQNTHFIGKR